MGTLYTLAQDWRDDANDKEQDLNEYERKALLACAAELDLRMVAENACKVPKMSASVFEVRQGPLLEFVATVRKDVEVRVFAQNVEDATSEARRITGVTEVLKVEIFPDYEHP